MDTGLIDWQGGAVAGDEEPVGSAGTDEPARDRTLATRVPPGLVLRWAMAATLGILIVLIAGWGLYAVRDTLVLVVIAMFVAVSLDPAVRWLIKHGIRRSYAVTIVVVAMLALFGIFMWSIVPPLVSQGSKLFADLPGYLRRLPQESKTFHELSVRYNLTNRLSELAATLPTRIAGTAVTFAQRFFGVVFSTLTVLVLTIYFMADMPRIRRGLVRLFPHRRRPQVADIVNVVVDKVGGYMIGNLIISLFAGVGAFICLLVVRVPFALPLAILVAVTDLIPLIGATLGAALCVLVTFFTAGLVPGIVVIGFFIVYQQVENYLIAPRVLRNTVDLSSVAVLLVALIGGSILGVVGALMAIPIAAAVKAVVTPVLGAMHQPPPPAEAVPQPRRSEPAGGPRLRLPRRATPRGPEAPRGPEPQPAGRGPEPQPAGRGPEPQPASRGPEAQPANRSPEPAPADRSAAREPDPPVVPGG